MFRRKFMTGLTVAAAAGASSLATASENRTVSYRIKGFSCITCAVGLDTILRRKQGVVRSESSYPAATTTIEFNPAFVNEKSLQDLISEMGFTASELRRGGK